MNTDNNTDNDIKNVENTETVGISIRCFPR